jgi:hypothetical protein
MVTVTIRAAACAAAVLMLLLYSSVSATVVYMDSCLLKKE